MQTNSTLKWLVLVIVVSLMVGSVSGVVGGGIGYAVASMSAYEATSPLSNLPTANPATAISALSATGNAVVDTVKKSEPAVVTIKSTYQQQSRRVSSTVTAEGSGVIIDQQGHIVTNAHVVQNTQQLQVVFYDGTQVDARLVGTDTTNDIAVLQVSGNIPAYLPLGDSDLLQVGETVIAIGSPLGDYRGSVTVGVVSGLDRNVEGSGQSSLIQTDAAISSGNSGGPLLNLSGQVVGINTLVVRSTGSGSIAEGLGFAIPSNSVAAIAKQLIAQSTSK